MSKILDGKKLSESISQGLTQKVRALPTQPQLVIIQVGNREESNLYIELKKKFAAKIGVGIIHKKYSETISQSKISTEIATFNNGNSVQGIIVQLPLPPHLDTHTLLELINPNKDIDGMTSFNIKLLLENNKGFIPATTRGILTLLDYYKIKLEGKRVTVIGRSMLVGKPTALALLNRNATVTICHIHSKNLKEETKRAHIVVVAVGKPKLIKKEYVSKDQIIVDVGINVLNSQKKNRKIVGDVDYDNVKDIVAAITPVPGGVGPMTIVSLFENLLDAYYLIEKKGNRS